MIENVFQILFLIIMSFGILGLPVYFVLNARKKRIASEYEQQKEAEPDNDETVE